MTERPPNSPSIASARGDLGGRCVLERGPDGSVRGIVVVAESGEER